MGSISAVAVKALRERTGLPMMDCKRALQDADGNEETAIEALRKSGMKTMEKRAGRETSAGRIGAYTDMAAGVGAMVELACESAPVANNEEFVQLANDLAQQLATGPGAATADELLSQTFGSDSSESLQQRFDDLTNRIREVFRLNRLVRIDAPCGGYIHHNGGVGVLLEIEGNDAAVAKDICMHVAAMRPMSVAKEGLDAELVEKEREILAEAARAEGKEEKYIENMVNGRMRNFFAERCLNEQPFVKDDKQTVGQFAEAGGIKVVRFVHWELGKE